MNIILVNKSDSAGGAAVACFRLLQALNSIGINAKMLVQEKSKINESIVSTTNNKLKKYCNFIRFVFERIIFLFHEKSKEIRFAFSLANSGEKIENNIEIKNANIIHFHWFNQGFLSLKSFKEVVSMNKPVVWTLHDMWAFTGGCHYSGDCENYIDNCGNCRFLKNSSNNDLSVKLLKRKKNTYLNSSITFVTCSKWLAEKAKQSMLLKNFRIETIPNPIDTEIFSPKDKILLRKEFNLPQNKHLILFASANILDKRKGFDYLIEALNLLKQANSNILNEIELIIFGKAKDDIKQLLPFKTNQLPYLHDMKQIAKIYALSDLFVLPSLEDNLPNTIMESLACGTPVTAFNTGGIPEMIEHKTNGFLADFKSADSLAKGIYWCLFEADKKLLEQNARKKVESDYSNKIISKKYLDLYKSITI